GGSRRRRQTTHIGEGNQEAQIDDEAVAFDDACVGENGGVLRDGNNDPASDDDGGVIDWRTRDWHDLRSTNRKILRLATLRKRACWRKKKRHDCDYASEHRKTDAF